jgi:flagellar biosynthesis GTPase FlhF
MEKVAILQLRPNPFRELDDYPIDREKVDKLKESISETGFWGTIVARKKGSSFEIAFGHHRKIALVELQQEGIIGKSEKVDIIVRDLTNEQMIQLMARENLEEWGTNAYIEAQTVESTIKAYGAGEIELPEVSQDTPEKHIRHVRRGSDERPYTVTSVAQFLGWTKGDGHGGLRENHACKVAFEMLDAFEIGIVSRKELRGVKRDVAREIISKAMALHREQERIASERRKMAKEAELRAADEEDARKSKALQKAAQELERQAEVAEASAKAVAKDFAKEAVRQTKAGNWAQRDIREAGDQAKDELRTKREQQFKTARQLYDQLRHEVCDMLNDKADDRFASLKKLLRMDCGLELKDVRQLREEVLALQSRAAEFAKELGTWKPKEADASEVSRLLKVVG